MNSIAWRSSRGNNSWRRFSTALLKTNFFLPISGAVFKKTLWVLPWRDLEESISILMASKCRTFKRFSYISYVLKIDFATLYQIIFCHHGVVSSCNFCYGGLVFMVLDLKRFIIPAIFAWIQWYTVSCIYFLLINLREWPHVMDTARNLSH